MPKKKRISTDAQLRAVKKYQDAHAEIKLRMLPEEKEKIQKAAKDRSDRLGRPVSVNRYILEAVEERIQRDAAGEPVVKTKEQPEEDIKKLVDQACKSVLKSRRSY